MNFPTARRRRWATAMVCGVLALGACGDQSAAGPTTAPLTPSAQPSPEPTSELPEPTPVATDRAGEPLIPPERPAAMANDDAAGAQAAAEYFIKVYGYAIQSQDLVEFITFCDPESVFCSTVIAEVKSDVAAGIRTEGGATILHPFRVDAPAEDAFYTVWGRLDREPFKALSAEGLTVFESEGEDVLDFAVGVEYSANGAWMLRAAKSGIVPAS